jgi:hypothetical protein
MKDALQRSFSCNISTRFERAVVGIATPLRTERFGVRISMGIKFTTPVKTSPRALVASCAIDAASLSPGVYQRVRGVDHPPHPALMLKK